MNAPLSAATRNPLQSASLDDRYSLESGRAFMSGVHALAQGHWTRLVLVPVALLTLAVSVARRVADVPDVLALAASLLSLLLFLAVVLAHTLREGPVTAHRLHGGVASYLLLGLTWAYAYRLLASVRPGAFSGVGTLFVG